MKHDHCAQLLLMLFVLRSFFFCTLRMTASHQPHRPGAVKLPR